jgi:hypothetical protein
MLAHDVCGENLPRQWSAGTKGEIIICTTYNGESIEGQRKVVLHEAPQ